MSERLRRLTLPVLVAVALFLAAVAVGYVTKNDGDGRVSPTEAVAAPGVRGSVQSLSGTTLTLLTEDGPKQYTLASDATVEVLRPTTAATIATGEWLNAGAIKNGQTMFAVVGLTLIPQALLQPR